MARRPTSIVNIAIRAIDETKRGLSAPIRNVKDLQKSLKSLKPVAAAAGAAVTGAFTLVSKELIDVRQEMAEFSDRIGINIESLSQLKFAAEQSGVGFRELQTSLQRMTRRVGEGTKATSDALESLGLTIADLQGKSANEQFQAIARGFDGIDDAGQRAAIAMKLFDTEGVKLLQMLGNGSAGLQNMMQQADALGLTIDSKSARAVQRLNEDMGGLTGAVKGLVNQFLIGLLPNLNALTSKESMDGLSNIQIAFYNIGVAVAALVKTLAIIPTAIIDVAAPFLVGLFTRAELQFKKFIQFLDSALPRLTLSIFNKIAEAINVTVQQINHFFNKLPKKVRQMMGLDGGIPEITFEFNTNLAAISPEITKEVQKIQGEVDALDESLDKGIKKLEELSTNLFDAKPPKELESPGAVTLQSIQPLASNGEDGGNGKPTIDNINNINTALNQTNINLINIGQTIGTELGSALGDIFSGAQRATEAFNAMGQAVMKMLGNIIGQIITVFLTEKVMTLALGKVIKGAQVAATAGYAAMIPTLATAATLSAIATGGASLKAAAGVPIAVVANNAVLGGINMMMGAMFGGQAHDGLTNVPREGTFLLNKGERVIAPEQNEDLTQFLAGNNAGSPTEININLDGEILARSMENLVDRNVVNINASSVI